MSFWCFDYVNKEPVKCGECWAWDETHSECRHGPEEWPSVDAVKGWCLKGRKKPHPQPDKLTHPRHDQELREKLAGLAEQMIIQGLDETPSTPRGE